MKNTFYPSFIIIVASLGLLYFVDLHHQKILTIERALEPVKQLSNARRLILDNKYHKAMKAIDQAVTEMKIIEQYADSSSNQHIEKAIGDLKAVRKEIENDSLYLGDMNKAYFNALNSIAHACVIISEKNLDDGKHYKAMRFLKASFADMVESLKFVEDEQLRAKEEVVIAHVQEILAKMKASNYTYRFNYDTINHELEELVIP